jgi:D-arginine dehydrogenase
MSHFDVIIVGGGIAGASLGVEIAAKRRTLIIEAEDQCGYHSTGRSAAFWLAHYGGPPIIPLTVASRPFLEGGWPTGERSLLRQRGAITIGSEYRHLWDAMSVETAEAPRRQELKRAELETYVPGLRKGWNFGLLDASCADIDVGALHSACLGEFRRRGGSVHTSMPLRAAGRFEQQWVVEAGQGRFTASVLVDAAGAWADEVARRCGVPGLKLEPYRRTVVQLRIGRGGLKDLPLVIDGLGRFYFKGESDNRIWVSPHDETASDPCDAAPDEVDVAGAIDHFQSVVDWPVEAVERKWAGLRSFTPARVPAYGFDHHQPGFFWCAGQGGFGIQTAPAAAKLAASLLLGEPDDAVAGIDPSMYAPRRFDRLGE